MTVGVGVTTTSVLSGLSRGIQLSRHVVAHHPPQCRVSFHLYRYARGIPAVRMLLLFVYRILTPCCLYNDAFLPTFDVAKKVL